MEIGSSSKFASVSSLPSASSYPSKIFEFGGRLWWSNGTNWLDIHVFVENDGSLKRLYKPKCFTLQLLNCSSGNNDLSGPASGKRWRILNWIATSNNGSLSTVSARLKRGGVYYQFQQNSSVVANGGLSVSTSFPILENGDTLAFNSTVANLNFTFAIEEFTTDSGLKSVALTSLSSGNNTLYTCPSGYFAKIGESTSIRNEVDTPGGLWYSNQSGGTRAFYANHVLSGGSPQAPSAASLTNCLIATSSSGSSVANNAFLSFSSNVCWMAAGDYISVNTNASTATQYAWINVCEYPIYV